MNRYIFLLHLMLVSGVSVFAQNQIINTAIVPGEKVSYKIYYNLAFIWFDAASVSFETTRSVYNQTSVFHFISKGESYPGYDWIFRVRDIFESKADSITFLPYSFYRNVQEGSHKAIEKCTFDYKAQKIFSYVNKDKDPIRNDTIKMGPNTYDLLSAIYFARNYNVNGRNPGDKIPLKMIIESRIFNTYLRYLGIETIEIPGGKKYTCIKLSVNLIDGSMFKGGEDMTIWVSNDKNKIPILIEAKILIGSVKAVVTEVKGTKYPFQL